MAEEDVNENEDDEGEEGSEDGEGEGGKKLDAKKIVMFIVLPLFVLAGIGGGLYFTGTLDKFLGKDSAAEHGAEDDGHGGKSAKKGSHVPKDSHGNPISGNAVFLEMPNMTVNLTSNDGQPRYLRLSVQLEMETPDDMHAVEAVMPRVVDQFQTYLRELRVKDLRGSAGIYRLQMELLSRVNAAAYPVEVKDVLFQEILIQ